MSKRVQSGHCTDALCLAVRTNAFLKTKMCPKAGSCSLGKNCSFAHSEEELRPLPEFKKTAICYNYRRGKCIDANCKFAHGDEDMVGYIPQPAIQARKICPFFIIGACRDENCVHAHMHSRRAASRLRTFLLAVKHALLGKGRVSVMNLRKKLKSGIPWQSLGFNSFNASITFLPGTDLLDSSVILDEIPETFELFDKLQLIIELNKKPQISHSTIPRDRLIGHEIDLFICPVCDGLVVDPVMINDCSHVVCSSCLTEWRSGMGSFQCPRCQSASTTGAITPLESDSENQLSSALRIIYDSISVSCDGCDWVGNPQSYSTHSCSVTSAATPSPPVVTPRASTAVATHSFAGVEEGRDVLPVEAGEILDVSAETDSGWVYATNRRTKESGWTPKSFLSSPPPTPRGLSSPRSDVYTPTTTNWY
jgi:hypothetical protein